MSRLLVIIALVSSTLLQGQDHHLELERYEQQKAELLKEVDLIEDKIVDIKHAVIIEDLKALGLPSDNYIEHSAMILEYAEEHEQARWVSHIILPDIATGQVYRTNDFRKDPKVLSGTAVQSDYFLTDTLADGTVNYDGYGYDRGHLAPSADFRWSERALSESYYYSNMSPQRPEFNREGWADLENLLRHYVMANKVPLYVVTAPVLSDGLDTVARAKNHLSIPLQYVKVAYDPKNQRGVGFVMPNAVTNYPLESYARTIDEVEDLIGLNLFPSISEAVENELEKPVWLTEWRSGDVEPIYQPSLPRHHFNTVVGSEKKGQNATVCGRVVASRYSRKGHLWLNLDKQFPNQLFSVFIRKNNLVHFDSDIKQRYLNENICVTGEVEKFSENNPPLIELEDDRKIKLLGVF